MLDRAKYLGIALGVAILVLGYAEHLSQGALLLIAFAYLAGATWATIAHRVAPAEDD